MAKVITFSRFFPAHHPKKGQPTNFIEKIWRSQFIPMPEWIDFFDKLNPDKPVESLDVALQCVHPMSFNPKFHTIRKGRRWKAGQKFSPRVWSGKPYNSKQIIIAPDITIVKTWDFEIIGRADNGKISQLQFKLYDQRFSFPENGFTTAINSSEYAKNDGLSLQDFLDWFSLSHSFKKTRHFEGQIICWSDSINY